MLNFEEYGCVILDPREFFFTSFRELVRFSIELMGKS